MTTGHKHRHITAKRGGLLHRLLAVHIFHTHNLPRVDRSPYPYALDECGGYCLTVLGILHRWTGLTLVIVGPVEEES